jgi:hypothetical protein
LFYGSILARREHFTSVKGYNESLEKWGGEDDNVRLRFMMFGLKMVPLSRLRVIHISNEERDGGPPNDVPVITADERRMAMMPKTIEVNGPEWGRDFNRIVFDWKIERYATEQ